MASILRTRAAPFTRSLISANRPGVSNFSRILTRKYTSANPGTGETPPDPSTKSSTNILALVGIGAIVVVGGAFYAFSSNDTTAKSTIQAAKVATNFVPSKTDYQKVYNKIASLLDASEYDDGSYAPVLIRLAWHASGTYDEKTNTGGSNYATMRFAPESLHGANNGLVVARNLMEQVKKEFPWISYGDLWTLAGVAAIQEMQGPKIPWRPGRIDGHEKDVTPDGRLPDAAQGQKHIRDIFYRMGFNDQEIVALIGAHAVGRCHPDRSGFEGPWTFSPTTFTNHFYKLLLEEKWVWRKWSGPKQLEDKKTKSLMMLPADYALVEDKSFKSYVKKYADDENVFFSDFSKAFSKLLELGVPSSQWVTPEPWNMKTLDEQADK
ncbi:hypothetical protein Clacol_000622 [Clathrus columnatus]|uniref:Peroxidase n=1 Tax=Clathrus columnatus TaxID=1419009 RepID=A0AAV5A3F7_9AGAM|nr:hypothetical protein Clacol_000622 [Clathrus columnatus]